MPVSPTLPCRNIRASRNRPRASSCSSHSGLSMAIWLSRRARASVLRCGKKRLGSTRLWIRCSTPHSGMTAPCKTGRSTERIIYNSKGLCAHADKPIEGHVMQLPPQLCHAIALETAQHNRQSLTQAATELSENYRSQRPTSGMFMATAAPRLAYAAVRMPATFAAARAVFMEIRRLMPERRITSLLDLGAGPGTAGWAATEVFDEVQQITLVEQDEGWIRTGKSLARSGENVLLAHADWVHAHVRAVGSCSA